MLSARKASVSSHLLVFSILIVEFDDIQCVILERVKSNLQLQLDGLDNKIVGHFNTSFSTFTFLYLFSFKTLQGSC